MSEDSYGDSRGKKYTFPDTSKTIVEVAKLAATLSSALLLGLIAYRSAQTSSLDRSLAPNATLFVLSVIPCCTAICAAFVLLTRLALRVYHTGEGILLAWEKVTLNVTIWAYVVALFLSAIYVAVTPGL